MCLDKVPAAGASGDDLDAKRNFSAFEQRPDATLDAAQADEAARIRNARGEDRRSVCDIKGQRYRVGNAIAWLRRVEDR